MVRLVYLVVVSVPLIIYYIFLADYCANHSEKYTEEECYSIAQDMVRHIKRNGHIKTVAFGIENLPENDGYIMYPNHQGKYDALGIISVHKNPCTVMIDEKASRKLIANQFVALVKGERLDKTDMHKQVKSIKNVANQVKEGRNYIIFPEGGYTDNHNNLQEFMPGAFKCAQLSKAPIVPVAIYDSYKPFGVNSLKPVTTIVSFMKPINYEEYEGMTTTMIANMVKDKIANEMKEIEKNRNKIA